jgi:thioredoxin reductase
MCAANASTRSSIVLRMTLRTDSRHESLRPPEKIELAVVGGGPAGLSAALEAQRAGMPVVVLEENRTLGGQIYKQLPAEFSVVGERALGQQYRAGRQLLERVHEARFSVITNCVVWSVYGKELAVVSSGSAATLRSDYTILAPGAYDRPAPVPGWTLPGVITAGGLQTLAKIQNVLPGQKTVIAGNGPLILAVAAQLVRSGGDVVALIEAAQPPMVRTAFNLARSAGRDTRRLLDGLGYLATLQARRIPVFYGHVPTRIEGRGRVTGLVISRLDEHGVPIPGTERRLEADAVCLGFGLTPSTELARLYGCEERYDPDYRIPLPVRDAHMETSVPGVFVVGDGGGIVGVASAIEQGRIAGIRVAARAGYLKSAAAEQRYRQARRRLDAHVKFQKALGGLYATPLDVSELARAETIICRCEDVSRRDVEAAARVTYPDVNALKAITRAGMGPCQGRNCMSNVLAISKATVPDDREHWPTARPPARPVLIGSIARHVDVDTNDESLPVDPTTT